MGGACTGGYKEVRAVRPESVADGGCRHCGPIELFLIPASAVTKAVVCVILSVG